MAKKAKPKEIDAFMEMLSDGAHVLDAIDASPFSDKWWYTRKKSDPELADRWNEAAKSGAKKRLKSLEGEADRRSKGYEEVTKVQSKTADGKPGRAMIKTVSKVSDTLLLRRIMAEAYRAGDAAYDDRQKQKLSGMVGVKSVDDMTEEELMAFLGDDS